MTIAARRTGWLTADFHAHFRILLLHTCARFALHCPVYCLMPDHIHLLLLGVSEGTDQKLAMKFLKRYLNAGLRPEFALQHQTFDHVLWPDECECGAFENVATYIQANPERAGLVSSWTDWTYAGCMIPGYPEMNPVALDHWEKFWHIHHASKERKS